MFEEAADTVIDEQEIDGNVALGRGIVGKEAWMSRWVWSMLIE
jgi:hypothetical protein